MKVESIANLGRTEIRHLRELRKSKGVIQLLASGEIDRHLYIAMEIGKCDLKSVMRRKIEKKTLPMQVEQIQAIWQNLVDAVNSVHNKRIIHGDIKPANFVSVKGVWKIIDFGLAKAMDVHGAIQRDTLCGTITYMAPEGLEVNAKLRKVSLKGVHISAFVPFLLTSL